MRGIRMRFEEQPGLCRKTRQAIPAAIRRGEARPEVVRPAQRPRPAARRLKALNDRKRMSLNTWASGVSADNPWRYSPYRPQRMQAPRSRLRSLAGLATAPGFSSPTPPARRRTSPAGGAGRHRTGCAVRRGGCRRGFPCRAADRRGAGPAPARWHGRQGAGANGGSAALDGMQGRGAALDIALAELAFELGEEVLHVRNEAPQHGRTISSGLPPKRPTISPRASTSSPASAAVAGAPCAAAEMTEQAKHRALLVDRLRHMVVHARRQGELRGRPARRWRSWRGSAARRSARRRGFSGSPRDHRYPASACPSAPRRTARSPPAPAERPPARRRRGHPGALAAQQLGGDRRFSALSSTSRRTPPRWVRSTGRGGGLPEAPWSPCNAAPSRPVAWA